MKNNFKEIEVRIDSSGVCTITLNRPDKHNAMNRNMIDELEEAGQYLTTHKSARLVLSLIHISSPRDNRTSRMPSSA